MEFRSITCQKVILQLPTIPDRFNPDKKSETWQASKLKVSERSQSKSPVHKNFFLPADPAPLTLSQNPSKTPTFRVKPDFSRIREKRLNELDSELDRQEMKINDLDSPLELESLFFSYSSYLEGIIQSVASSASSASSSHVYKSHLTRAKNGFVSVFRRVFPKLKHISGDHDEKASQTLMSINPNKFSVILSKLGDVVNEELAGTEKLEKFIQKNFIVNKRKAKVSNVGTQSEFRTGDNGVISYDFKTYEELEDEFENMKKVNAELLKERAIMELRYEKLNDTDKLVYRNKVLESMVIRMRHSGTQEADECLGAKILRRLGDEVVVVGFI